jgi:hypothetical protein
VAAPRRAAFVTGVWIPAASAPHNGGEEKEDEMTRSIAAVVSILALVGAVVGCSSAGTVDPPKQPDPTFAPVGREVLSVSAKGVQRYRVERKSDGTLAPKFFEPRADLFAADGRKVGTHFMTDSVPTWEIDGKRVTGKKVHERPSSHSGAITELQLAATVSGSGGPFDGVAFVERLDTTGGAAPALDASMHEGDVVESPYEARYAFFAAAR